MVCSISITSRKNILVTATVAYRGPGNPIAVDTEQQLELIRSKNSHGVEIKPLLAHLGRVDVRTAKHQPAQRHVTVDDFAAIADLNIAHLAILQSIPLSSQKNLRENAGRRI